jgi:hypothetical protein
MIGRNMPRSSAATLLVMVLFPAYVGAEKRYDPGMTDTEIKIRNIMPYTGLFSEYGAIGRTEAAYFQMISDRGGSNNEVLGSDFCNPHILSWGIP